MLWLVVLPAKGQISKEALDTAVLVLTPWLEGLLAHRRALRQALAAKKL